MSTYKTFLASSFELKTERISFENFINRENKILQKRNVFLELTIWEDLHDEVSLTRKQDDYNKALKACDIFIIMYWTKMGKYTNEEFDMALAQLKLTKKNPKIYVYEKTAIPAIPGSKNDKDSLAAFKKKLEPHHFPTQFETYDRLENAFKKSLDELFRDGYLKYGEIARTLHSDGHGVTASFIGRQEELKTIREKLDAGGRIMLIHGEGGIGKTSLAAKYWEENLYRYKYNAWLFCENGIVQELKKLAPELKLDFSGMDEAQQIAALKLALMNVSNDFLLVLDNANNPKHIEEFKKTFRGFHWHVLITSRPNGILEKEQEYRIGHLPPPLAKDLFKSNYREDTTEFDALLDRLLEAVNYHTLLVEIFSKNMKQLREFGETLKDFLEQLETKGLFLEERSFKLVTDYTDSVHKEAGNSDAIISILYDFSMLAETERYWLVNIALLPAVNHALVFLIDLFEPENKFDFRAEFRTLSEKGWLANEENGFRISPVVQKLVLYKHKESLQEDGEVLINNLNEKLENDGLQLLRLQYTEAGAFIQLIPAITKHLKKQPLYGIGLLNFNACVYHLATGDLVQARQATVNYGSISKHIENWEGLAISYRKLGDIYEQTGDWQNALKNYNEQLRIFKEIYEASPENLSYKNDLAISFEKLGGIYEQTGDRQNALKNYNELFKIGKEIYEASPENLSYKNGLAISFEKLGDIYEQTGDWQSALKNYNEDFEIMKEIYEASPENLSYKNGLGVSYSKLGGIYEQTGDWQNALKNYNEYFKISKEIYEASPENLSYKNNLAISYQNLGGIYEQTGDWQNALKNYNEYFKISKEIYEASPENLSYKNNLAISYQNLGGIYEQTGDWQNALKNYNEYFKISKEIYEASPENLSYKNGLAISYQNLGGIYEQTGDRQNALKNYNEYFKISKEIYEASPENLSYKNNLAISYQNLGGIYEQTGDWQNALKNYNEDFEIMKEIYEASPENLSYKNGLGVSYSKLGGIYEQTGDWQNALKNYNEYFKISKEIYEASPENLSYKNGLAISYQNLGGIYEQTGDQQNALKNYIEYFKISKEIYEASPENLSYKNGLAISYSKLGGIYEQTGDRQNTLKNYNEYFKISKEIYEASPENLSYKNNLAISYSSLGSVYLKLGDKVNAIKNFNSSKEIWKVLVSNFPDHIEFKNNLNWVENNLKEM